MNLQRFEEIVRRYADLKIAVVGDLCLDRYFEINPALAEVSIETQLPVHNVTRVRCQPGGAGTILSNLAALGVGEIYIAAIIGEDGEGYELRRSLAKDLRQVRLNYLLETKERRTFTYTKPLLIEAGKPPVELNRLDIKNWTPTPDGLQWEICDAVQELAEKVDVIILLDQVDVPDTGVVTSKLLETVEEVCALRPELLVMADSRRGLKNYPPVAYKMNSAELARLMGMEGPLGMEAARENAARLAGNTGKPVFVTLSEHGILAAKNGQVDHVPALPTRGPIDIVGAGDSVTAALASALASGATLRESLELASLASSLVIHQLGTTGTATPQQMLELLHNSGLLEA